MHDDEKMNDGDDGDIDCDDSDNGDIGDDVTMMTEVNVTIDGEEVNTYIRSSYDSDEDDDKL